MAKAPGIAAPGDEDRPRRRKSRRRPRAGGRSAWFAGLRRTRSFGTTCGTCGQRVRKYNPHHMDRSKVIVLRDLALAGGTKDGWVRMPGDERLAVGTRTFKTCADSRVHAQRLRWFGLVDLLARRTGTYRVNAQGHAFLKGRLAVPVEIHCRDGRVFWQSPHRVTIREVEGVILGRDHWDNYSRIQVDPHDV